MKYESQLQNHFGPNVRITIRVVGKSENLEGRIVQWNFDLRKILGVTKNFLKSRFFLISNTTKSLIPYGNNSKLPNDVLKYFI